ncbi:hypothetical protein [Rhodoferax lithotrophicus]|uniref:hypothetical protein n=1 Tax=Rhodoferax lithotrophicus TaxID=2798804 RepID=UPI001CC5CE1C|nr:hypothetical protein [Rhodoferax sp. MIZ03]
MLFQLLSKMEGPVNTGPSIVITPIVYLVSEAAGAALSAFFVEAALCTFFAVCAGFEAASVGVTAAASFALGSSTFLTVCLVVTLTAGAFIAAGVVGTASLGGCRSLGKRDSSNAGKQSSSDQIF